MIPITLFGWPVVVVILFATIKPRVAALTAYLGAWLFLPMAAYKFAGLPGYGKMEAASYGALLGVLLFDSKRLSQVRFHWLDVPIVVWCLSPMATSILNGLGAYDGVSSVFGQVVSWGVPYLIGRLYFIDLEGLRTLAIGIVIGGLIYLPLCLFEIRMSPRLHIWVYGYHQHSWVQTHRLGGWRPTVFMQHGLAVAMWMTTASIAALWLWWSGTMRKLWNVPMPYIVASLFATTVLCKSAGAIGLLAMGTGALATVRNMRTGVVVWCLLLAPVLYMGVRGLRVWDGSHLLEAVASLAPDKQGSLRYRMEAEDMLSEHALRRPVFGWGGHSRNRPAAMGHEVDNVATDGFWIIALGQRGIVGLTALTAIILLPATLVFRHIPVSAWLQPTIAPGVALALCLVLFMIDSLFNAMMNPVYVLTAGALTGVFISNVWQRRSPARWDRHFRISSAASVAACGRSAYSSLAR